jgi:hypothetical protein
VAWTQFVVKIYEHFDTDTHHLVHLTKFKQTIPMEVFIVSFEQLAFRTEGMTYAFFRECFISGLKDEIFSHVLMAHARNWLEADKREKEAKQVVSFQTKKTPFIPLPKPTLTTPLSTPLKIHKLTQAEMDKNQLKGLCYNCDDKYFLRHKCKEHKIFMAMFEDVSEEKTNVSPIAELPPPVDLNHPFDETDFDPLISLNALTSFSAPQTLKLIGYIKNQKVIILVDSGNTHNFIHRHISQEVNFYIHPVNNFQIMIGNAGSMKCGGHCENVCLQIGQYHLKSHMFVIDMGGCDIVLGSEWLHTLVSITMDFHKLTMQFQQEGQQHQFQGITTRSPEIISSHRM